MKASEDRVSASARRSITRQPNLFVVQQEVPFAATAKGLINVAKVSLVPLEAQKAEGYDIKRVQQYVEIETWTVTKGNSREELVSITLGSSQETGYSTSKTIGTEIGSSVTDSKSLTVEAGLEAGPVKVSASGTLGQDSTSFQNFLSALEINQSSTSIVSTQNTLSVKDTYNGLGKGVRYVLWQVVDRITLTRTSDGMVISQVVTLSNSQVKDYPYP